MTDTIITTVLAVLIFVTGYVIDRRHGEAAQLTEEVDDLREKLKTAEDERDGWRKTMPDREKVITALQHCIDKPCHTNCPYFDPKDEGQAYCLFRKIMPDALALLKEQEARVMTREEIRTGEIETLWIEVEGKPHIFPGIWYRRSKKDGIPAIDITLNTGIVRGTVVSYGYAWRCWTSRPTPEQMRETKWEGDKE